MTTLHLHPSTAHQTASALKQNALAMLDETGDWKSPSQRMEVLRTLPRNESDLSDLHELRRGIPSPRRSIVEKSP